MIIRPELTSPRVGGTLRWHCAFGCGWHYDEFPGFSPHPPEPLRAATDLSDLDDALSRQAARATEALFRRVEDAMTAHMTDRHVIWRIKK